MSEFIEECRREWRRLGVPDPVANEMAADLAADLEEAEAEGGSAEDVLGNSAFDPRRFAAAWAVARGVTGPPPAVDRQRMWRPPVSIALAALLGAVAVVAALALLVGRGSRSVAFAVHRIAAVPGPNRIFVPGPGRMVGPGPFGPPFAGTQITSAVGHPVVWLLLVVGMIGAVGLGLVVLLYWSPWSGHRRDRDGGRRTPSWN